MFPKIIAKRAGARSILTAATALTVFSSASPASGQTQTDPATPQAELPLTINDGFDGPDALRFDWPEILIGTGQYEDGPTGATVIRFKEGAQVAMDASGGGPGTLNSDYVAIGYPHALVDAIVLSGGTFYGLETATALNTALLDDGTRSGAWNNVGLTLGSIIYDMGPRRYNEIYPDKRLAQAALRAAEPGVFPRGAYGGGRFAVNGALWGCHAKSGQGAAFRQIGDIKVAVFTVVNALGAVTDRDGNIVACYKRPGWPDNLTAHDLMSATPDSLQPDWDGEHDEDPDRLNTTISVVVTNRKMSQVELKRLAVQVNTSMARAIQPYATELDGDVLYAVSTGEVQAGPGDSLVTAEIGTVASELMWDAILSAVPEQPEVVQPLAGARPDPALLAGYAGDYRFSDYASFRVTARGGKLYAEGTGNREIRYLPSGEQTELQPAEGGLFTVPRRYPMVLRFEADRVVVNPGRWQQVGTRTGE
ncbi:peptidase S58 DmpA [Pacificimonas flava]|uniref:Peptidase S58 DmpA n=2 Tax=Pacificimonas TaxID=1960290 RepID=A0A219B8U1_9SPHN|nr:MULTISPECIES: P1 family peptidase [Pacificimonas]MBZ6378533.1 P1 family peptidase [Pacificimonas aurantium]OWV34178.1 peptidase S58 DmpA [Pacificimonas flava]